MSQLDHPQGICVHNGEVFIADSGNHRVRKVLRNGQIVTIAGTGSRGDFNNPRGQLMSLLTASKPSPLKLKSCFPVPAIVEMIPRGSIFRIRCPAASEM